jgi:hypothetical protein
MMIVMLCQLELVARWNVLSGMVSGVGVESKTFRQKSPNCSRAPWSP